MGIRQSFLRGGREGSVSVEAALVIPLMLIFLLGTYEVTGVYRANMKLIAATNAMAVMVAEQTAALTPGSTGMMGNFCTGSQRMMLPQNPPIAFAVVSVSNIDGKISRDWETDNSCPTTASNIGAGTAVSLATSPASLVPNPGDSVIIVKSSTSYGNLTSFVLAPNYNLTAVAWARPRSNKTIACSGC